MKTSILTIAGLFFVGACTANGGTGNPLVRPFQYFSYANGDDIRSTCEPGGPSNYRMIYNALYEQQVRTYDIRQDFNGKSGEQETRVFSHGIGGQIEISKKGLDFKSNFRSSETLSYEDLVAIDNALVSSQFEQPSINGQILHSDEFYWIAMVCRDGNFKYYAWTQSDTDIENLPFLEVLQKGDTTGADVQHFKIPVIHDRGGRDQGGRGLEGASYFSLEVGDNALKL